MPAGTQADLAAAVTTALHDSAGTGNGSVDWTFAIPDHDVDFPSYHKTGDDMKFINGLDSLWTGALPATFLYDGAGHRLRFWEGRQTYETFSHAVHEVLKGRGTDSTEVKT